ncbi:MAG: glycosyltransferase [Flavobacteriia bacterium]|jgi:glycosyltransferase involved in cell wall biosynthesis
MLKISVAICTYNRERYLPQLFNSILKQTLDRSQFEVILINNNSPGNTSELFDAFRNEHPEILTTYAIETNQGLSFARNHAIELAKFPLITFLDDDAFIQENYLEICVKAFEADANMDAMGGKILLNYESNKPAWENKYLNALLGFYNPGDKKLRYSKKDYPRGSNMIFKTDLFKEVGGFHTGLGRTDKSMIGGEEKELFDRVYKAKLCVYYEPKALVFHCVPVERTTSTFIRRQAIGAGMSERVRTKTVGTGAFISRCFREVLLWCASIFLWFIFLFKMKPAKGNMIIAFRWWLSQGLIGWKRE